MKKKYKVKFYHCGGRKSEETEYVITKTTPFTEKEIDLFDRVILRCNHKPSMMVTHKEDSGIGEGGE